MYTVESGVKRRRQLKMLYRRGQLCISTGRNSQTGLEEPHCSVPSQTSALFLNEIGGVRLPREQTVDVERVEKQHFEFVPVFLNVSDQCLSKA